MSQRLTHGFAFLPCPTPRTIQQGVQEDLDAATPERQDGRSHPIARQPTHRHPSHPSIPSKRPLALYHSRIHPLQTALKTPAWQCPSSGVKAQSQFRSQAQHTCSPNLDPQSTHSAHRSAFVHRILIIYHGLITPAALTRIASTFSARSNLSSALASARGRPPARARFNQ